MKESRFYREVIEEGRQEGELKTRREDILDALRDRFGEAAATPFTAALNASDDPAELRRLHRLAVNSQKLDEFRCALPHLEQQP